MYASVSIRASRLFALPISGVLRDVSKGNDTAIGVGADNVFAKERNDAGVSISGWIGRGATEARGVEI